MEPWHECKHTLQLLARQLCDLCHIVVVMQFPKQHKEEARIHPWLTGIQQASDLYRIYHSSMCHDLAAPGDSGWCWLSTPIAVWLQAWVWDGNHFGR